MYHGERLNSITHLVGAVLSVVGAAILVTVGVMHHRHWDVIVSFVIYSLTLILLYTTSTLYHSFQGRPKAIFQRLDHSAIYLLIAGSYTPFTLVTLRGHWGWTIFGVNWTLAIFGIAQEGRIRRDKGRILSLVIYLVMGWMIVFAAKPLFTALPSTGLWLLGCGGLAYTLGIVFYVIDERMRHAHGIWHLFVLAGSALQYLCVLGFLA